MSRSASLQTLPTELIEHIIIYSAYTTTSNDNENADENPLKPVANLSQTCRRLHSIIYDSHLTDTNTKHGIGGQLWKEVFLAVWDDPRIARDMLTRIWAESEKQREIGSGNGNGGWGWG